MGIEEINVAYETGKKHEMDRIVNIIDEIFDKTQKEINAHVKNFGIEGNRDIDSREKSLLLTLPITLRRRLKEEFAKSEPSEVKDE